MPPPPINIDFPFWFQNMIWISGFRHYAIIVAIPSNHCQDFSCKYICLISWSQNGAKISGRDLNLISSEGGQDISACQILGHLSHAFCRKYPETSNLTDFTTSERRQNEENQQTMTITINF